MIDSTFSSFIKNSEQMVKPETVSIISLASQALGSLPLALQRNVMKKTAKTNGTMGFIVEPYSLFLAYEIINIDAAEHLIPSEFKIIPTKIFDSDTAKPHVIFGIFNAHTSAFWGSRIEMYIIAEHRESGMLSWIIVDYDTNTNSFDPKKGFISGNVEKSTVTSTCKGTLLVDVKDREHDRRIELEADLTKGKMSPLFNRLWIEGNLSIGYGKDEANANADPFSLIFNPEEMKEALSLPIDAVKIHTFTWFKGLFASTPSTIACFPYAQHYITTTAPLASGLKTEADLFTAYKEISEAKEAKGLSVKELKRMLVIGVLTSWVLIAGLILLLIFK